MTVSLKQVGNNQSVVTINGVCLYFSYAACIAYDAPTAPLALEYPRLFNPAYRRYSQTTSKHATQMGVSHFPDAPSASDFERELKRVLS